MQKQLKGRAMLLAGVSAIVLGGATQSRAQTVTWGAKTPDIIAPEPADKSKKKTEKFTPTVTRTVVTRTLITGTTTTTTVTETLGDSDAPGAIGTQRATTSTTDTPRETTGLTNKPYEILTRDAPKKQKSEKPAKPPAEVKEVKKESKKKPIGKADKIPAAVPAGPLHIIVSVDQQRASLYTNGTFVASTKVSTGTKTHPTPMGVFSVIQKNRHHISNLYNAPMPYMQRLTWSGTAMHTGPLPGYPASHGCIRLTDDFAQLLWKATKIGARVIVTREDVKPVEFAHARLIMPRPQVAALPRPASPMVRTADATSTVTDARAQQAIVTDPTNAEPPIDPRIMVTEAVQSSQEIERRSSPVSIFVSRKDGKLYVRQAMQPLFDVPVALRDPDQPIGTHVYTAMELKDGAMRWTAVTIPSGYRSEQTETKSGKKKSEPAKPAVSLPPSDAAAALERFDMPQEALERLAALLIPGSSLIVSDNGIGGETGTYTDFIVLTR
jgi:lipoprotein-anchoring transpeptidase ErfK/SrfK